MYYCKLKKFAKHSLRDDNLPVLCQVIETKEYFGPILLDVIVVHHFSGIWQPLLHPHLDHFLDHRFQQILIYGVSQID